ncbi:P-II family nitrogen regulator [Thiomicrorhabdus heinhorstiae]|uniref:Uncharacterized protein n=1 Tax=Thiomicrorhabdus heinhorstiae TaxID=2748010 RepID=A0ABS0BYY0_9GAMM|nr:hypothetical protein [Thiomicrorhabdus heinhorstiae]MBF6059005.1 hypothetical protein [Thiomicrorhabdus heinhorstiae]
MEVGFAMEWIEDNYDGETWSFNSEVAKPVSVPLKQANKPMKSNESGKKIQILTNRLMEGKIMLLLKKLGLKSYTVCDARGDGAPEFEMIRQPAEKNILFSVSVNQREQASLQEKINQFAREGQAVTLYLSGQEVMVPIGRG